MNSALWYIAGLLTTPLLIGIDLYFHRKVDTRGIVGHIERKGRGKAEVIMPEPEDFDNFINNLKQE